MGVKFPRRLCIVEKVEPTKYLDAQQTFTWISRETMMLSNIAHVISHITQIIYISRMTDISMYLEFTTALIRMT